MNRNRYIILIAALSLISVGCSDMATKDAPIEERAAVQTGSAATPGGPAAAVAKTPPAAETPTPATTAAAQVTPPAAQVPASTAAQPVAGVQTHGATTPSVEAHALPAATVPPPGASGVQGVAAAAQADGVSKYADMRTPPADPANLLSKRVIHFDYDSSVIKDEYRDLVKAHAEFLKAAKEAKAVLQGHTDERGSRDYNLALGQRRAESVQQAMVLLGVDVQKLESVSLGEEKPLKDGHDESAWSQNRRVEIYYLGE